MNKKRAKIRDYPITICGEEDFGKWFGITSPTTQAKLRAEGLPCMHNGHSFVYECDKVIAWMKDKWTFEKVEIRS
ncbi:MAG: hypothetical protein LBV72_00395 [Tannerella sp.]|jgi:hypothetical protein|nr:hypothetical protein [Tannerella sp.]